MTHIFRMFAGALLLAAGAAAAQEAFVEGQHYQTINPAQPTSVTGQIEVVEMFWYGCPHCFSFEPYVASWLKTKPADVALVRIPAVFSAQWEVHARAFYAAETLGALEKIHEPLFDAIHRDRAPLHTEDALAAFVAGHGVAEQDFRKAFHSFAVDGKINRAKQLSRNYGITGVPAVIVNGKYRASASSAGSYENLLKLVDFLVDKERAGLAATAAR